MSRQPTTSAPPDALPAPPAAVARLRRAATARLLPWFRANAREMPWRVEPRDPYRVWVSEIMLQQTRVETVRDYFPRFLEAFPTPAALAAAPLQSVLKAWEGLGYYARARAMHRAAQRLVRDFGGELPRDPSQLAKLPGFGPYTTAAVASFAFGEPLAVLDGNVGRVLSRLLAYEPEWNTPRAARELRALAQTLLPPPPDAAPANEAWMELGALVCTPRAPRCSECPLAALCAAARAGAPEDWPRKRKKMKIPHKIVGAAVPLAPDGRILIAQRRPEGGMLAGLWEFPGGKQEPGETMQQCIARELREEMGLELEVGPELTVVHHAYTHFTIELHAHFARVLSGEPRHIECAGHAWVRLGEMDAYPFSKADLEIIRALRALPAPPSIDALFPS